MEKDISDEEFERVKRNLHRFSYLDLVLWQNELLNSGTVNNRLYNLIDNEVKRRYISKNTEKKEAEGRSK